jgi:FG-GAP repeat protein
MRSSLEPLLATGLVALLTASPAFAGFTLIRTYDGPAAGSEFGYSCAVIGDMDGDGIDEFAIGAPGDATGGPQAGRVFIYRGGDPLSDQPAWVITGAPGERLGHSLAWAYVDDDFVPDLVIGAPGSGGAPATLTGRIVIAYGGSPLGARPLVSVAGTTADGRFGWAVERAAPFASYSLRILVGAPDANAGAGEVHGLLAGNPPATRAFVLHGDAEGEQFGYALACAGITRGYLVGPEFLVGAPGAAVNGPNSGRAAIYFYDSAGDTIPDSVVQGPVGDRLGQSITGGVDINPNYFEPSDDIVLGAPGADVGGLPDAGSSYVYADQSPFAYDGAASQAAFGSTVRLMHDVTGTWLPDLAVGESNAVRVYQGPLAPWLTPLASLIGEAPGDEFGSAISSSGHIDPAYTQRNQFLIGAPQHAGIGRVYVYTDVTPPTGVSPGNPAAIALAAPLPNPSHGAFALLVDLPHATLARLAVYDVAGRRVATLHDGALGPGRIPFAWTPRATDAAGLYWAVLEADGARFARRMMRVR